MKKKIDFLLQYICSPETKSELIETSSNKTLIDNSNNQFSIIDDIPVLLKSNATEIKSKTDLHTEKYTDFKYVEHYQKDAQVFDYFIERNGATKDENRRIAEYIESKIPKKTKLILDIGCGNAWVAKRFCKKGFNVISMDISHTNVKKALENYPFENHFGIVADVFNLPFKKNIVDCIISSEVIEHVTNPKLFVENLFRILKPEGALIITTPYKEKIIYSLCVHCNQPTPSSAHLHSFNENILTDLIKDENLEKVEYERFANKIIGYFRLFVILRIFGFKIWKFIDKLFSLLYNKQLRIIVKWTKK
jgi:2-polyprenyl-3-methyl-5-hydroxy-6-metoxy-1,4-benzoquinol methylase